MGDLAKEFGLTSLFYALRKCRPYKWRRNCGEDGERYASEVEEWFTTEVLPVMEEETNMAVRPLMLDEKQRLIRPPNDTKLLNPFHRGG